MSYSFLNALLETWLVSFVIASPWKHSNPSTTEHIDCEASLLRHRAESSEPENAHQDFLYFYRNKRDSEISFFNDVYKGHTHPFSSLTLLKTMSCIHSFFVEILPNGVTECVTQLQIAHSITLFHPSRFSSQQYHLHCCREFTKQLDFQSLGHSWLSFFVKNGSY